jgi:hypothetical protein
VGTEGLLKGGMPGIVGGHERVHRALGDVGPERGGSACLLDDIIDQVIEAAVKVGVSA